MSEVIELDSVPGCHINAVCDEASDLARNKNKPVHFVFNDTHVTVQPGESGKVASARWSADFEAAAKAWRESPERKAQKEQQAAKEKADRKAHMAEAASTEAAMRDAQVPWPKTELQLTEYIKSLVDRQHGYGTCAYAISMAAEAAFNYVSGQLGVTGFQASFADMDFIRRTRRIKGPFMLIKLEDALYPQYDLQERLREMLDSNKQWFREEATKKLLDTEHAHPDVIAHWKKLAGLTQ